MAIPLAAIRTTLAAYFNTTWGATTPIAWTNAPITPPAKAPWVRFSLLWADAPHVLISGTAGTGQRLTGLIVIQLFAPLDVGDGTIYGHAQTAMAALTEKRLAITGVTPTKYVETGPASVLTIGDTSGGRQGIAGDAAWFQLNVQAEVSYLDTA